MPDWNSNSVPARGNFLGKFFSARYIMVSCGLLAMTIIYAIQLDLSIPAGARDIVSTAKCRKGCWSMLKWIPILNNETCRTFSTSENATTGWSEPLQGSLFISYLIGYIISQIPAAYIVERKSAKCVMIFSLLIHVVCLLLMPIADRLHCSLMHIIRISEGIGGGVAVPAMHALLANWSPTNELNWMSCLMYSGTSLGIALSMLSIGWTLIFGTPAFLLIMAYVYLIEDTPNKQPLIGINERNYINSRIKTSDERSSTPWKDILTSTPFLAILVAHTCFYWGWYTFLIGTSVFFEEVFHFNIKENGIAAVPLFTMWIFSLVLGKLLDVLSKTGSITTTIARQVATAIASIIPIICLILLCLVGNDVVMAGIIVGVAVTSLGAMFCGFLINHIDIAPNYAGTLMALTNTVATIPGFILPMFIDAVTQGDQTVESWRLVFAVASVFYIIGLIAFVLYGTGDEEPWNRTNSSQFTVSYSGTRNETTPFRGAGGSSIY